MTDKSSAFTTELLEALRAAIPDGSDVATLARGNSNLVTAIRPDGILIETDRSRGAGTGPRLIPAWMVETAWQHLQHHGTLTNAELLDNQGLGVKDRRPFVQFWHACQASKWSQRDRLRYD